MSSLATLTLCSYTANDSYLSLIGTFRSGRKLDINFVLSANAFTFMTKEYRAVSEFNSNCFLVNSDTSLFLSSGQVEEKSLLNFRAFTWWTAQYEGVALRQGKGGIPIITPHCLALARIFFPRSPVVYLWDSHGTLFHKHCWQ